MKKPMSSALIKRERNVRLIAVILLIAITLWVIAVVENMLSSVIIALVISYLLNPIVNQLERRGFKRTYAIGIPYIIGGVLIGALFYLFYPIVAQQIRELQSEIPKYQEGLNTLMTNFEDHARELLRDYYTFDLSANFFELVSSSASTVVTSIPNLASKVFTVLVLSPFFAFFMLRDGRLVTRHILKMVPNNLFELALNLSFQLNKQMGDFIRARLLEAIIVGAVVWLGLNIIDFPYATLISIFAALTNLIPYIGPFIGAVPALAIALINNEPSVTLALVGLTFAIAQVIDMLFIIPLVVAKIVNLHPVLVIVVIIIGSHLLGVMGMIISIPVASALKLSISAVYNHLLNFRS